MSLFLESSYSSELLNEAYQGKSPKLIAVEKKLDRVVNYYKFDGKSGDSIGVINKLILS